MKLHLLFSVGGNVRRISSSSECAGERPALSGPHCTSVYGFSFMPVPRLDQLERLMRTGREAVSPERLAQGGNGKLMYRCTGL